MQNQQAGQQAKQNEQNPLQALLSFMKTKTPQQAKNEINEMLQSGKITQQQLEMMMGKAQQIGEVLGIK